MAKYRIGGIHSVTGQGKRFAITAADEAAALEIVRQAGYAPTSVKTSQPERRTFSYEYETISMSPRFGNDRHRTPAHHLKEVISEMALSDWEYVRADQFSVPQPAGLVSRIMGHAATPEFVYVLTFRRPVR